MHETKRLSYRLWRSYRKLRPDVRGLLGGEYPEFVFRHVRQPLAGELPVFVFHSVAAQAFERQLRYLKDNGYETLPSADVLVACLQQRHPLRPKTVALTFDDGRASLYRVAYPLLRRYGYRAISFVVPTFVGQRNFCTWEQLREMAESRIVDVQSHTLCHRFAPRWPRIVRCLNGTDEVPLEAGQYRTMEADYRRSRELIEARLGQAVRHLCYPDYQGTEASIQASRTAGYVSNFWGVVRGRRTNRVGDDPYRIMRVGEVYLECLPGRSRRTLLQVASQQVSRSGTWLRRWMVDPSGQQAEQVGGIA